MSRLNELQEIVFMALKNDRQDIVDSVQDELNDLEVKEHYSNVRVLGNDYLWNTPQYQILSNQLNNLCLYFGKDKVMAMCSIMSQDKIHKGIK